MSGALRFPPVVLCDRCHKQPYVFIQWGMALCPACLVVTGQELYRWWHHPKRYPRRAGIWLTCIARDFWWGLHDGIKAIGRWGL